MFLSSLHVYPIKSLKGIALTEARVEKRGLQYDRRWILVDSKDQFMTQREYPKLAVMTVSVERDGLSINFDGQEPLYVPFEDSLGARIQFQVWNDTCQGVVIDGDAHQWFSDAVGTKCRLVYMPDDSERLVNPNYSVNRDIVSFADGYPFLMTTEASLAELNKRLATPVSMNRFRPNLVIAGATAFAEDDWKRVTIGSVDFHVAKPCARCVTTTVDQERGEKTGDEPLRTLSSFRLRGNEVHFGQNLIATNDGQTLHVGEGVRASTIAP